jgi:adenylate kinase family enzyme
MVQYDFLNLSPSEFENLSRDLLQKEFKVHIESFTEGKDGGIDLRFAKVRSKNEIIQCKRYKDFNSLLYSLKQEIIKVKNKKPAGYYVTTSVGLTPGQKTTIYNLFEGYIREESHIYGRDDLNNLLGKYQDIEKKYYKLWLSSMTILDKIIHGKIYNQTEFEKDKISEQLKLYVQNDSFAESLKILNENNFVIISGIPGIGKTTLARILVWHLLAKGFEEFTYLSDSISEGYTFFKEEKKQIFLFDDFLGRNFLETSREKSEEKNIVTFIEKIKKSKNKILIFTTREYILKQAQIKYESFKEYVFDKSKYTIDLSKYTKIVRAQILYNHLYFSGLPTNYAEVILKDNFYLKLIDHRNYNPRIIETFTRGKIWEKVGTNDFQERLQRYFDNPNEVWRYAYENQITDLSKCVLAIMFIAGAPILYDDLLKAVQSFAEKLSDKYKIGYSESKFKESLKELENTFIISTKDDANIIAIEYQNPSIQDFLVNHLGEQSDFISDLIETSIFFNQLSRVFTFEENVLPQAKIAKQNNKILLKNAVIDIYWNKLMLDFDRLNSSVIQKKKGEVESNFLWYKSHFSTIGKLSLVTEGVEIVRYNSAYSFIRDKFFKIINSNDINDEIEYFVNVLSIFKDEISIHPNKIIKLLAANVYSYWGLQGFKQLNKLYPKEFAKFESLGKCLSLVEEIAESIYNSISDSADNNDWEGVLVELQDLDGEFGSDLSGYISDIQEKIGRNIQDNEEINYYDEDEYKITQHEKRNEELDIINMFSSLKYD